LQVNIAKQIGILLRVIFTALRAQVTHALVQPNALQQLPTPEPPTMAKQIRIEHRDRMTSTWIDTDKKAITEESLINLCGASEGYDAEQGYVRFKECIGFDADADAGGGAQSKGVGVMLFEEINQKSTISEIESSLGKTVESIVFTNY
jgi:hypothetical protein